MQRRANLPPALRRRFRTGRPCLDLVHTGGDGELAVWEIVHDAADLARWLAVILDLPAVRAQEADLAAMRTLRAAITRIAHGAAADAPRSDEGTATEGAATDIAASDVAALNAAAAAAPLVPALRPGPLRAEIVDPTAAAALATLARDAVDLFGGPLAGRIRVCTAGDCGLLFVDASRPGTRRWCSMERCGNLAKVRRHRS